MKEEHMFITFLLTLSQNDNIIIFIWCYVEWKSGLKKIFLSMRPISTNTDFTEISDVLVSNDINIDLWA